MVCSSHNEENVICKRPSNMDWKTKVRQINVCTESSSLHIANTPARQWNATARWLINCIWQRFIFSCMVPFSRTPFTPSTRHFEECLVFIPDMNLQSSARVAGLSAPHARRPWGFSFASLRGESGFTLCSVYLTVLWHNDSRTTQKIEAAVSISLKSSTIYFHARPGGGKDF